MKDERKLSQFKIYWHEWNADRKSDHDVQELSALIRVIALALPDKENIALPLNLSGTVVLSLVQPIKDCNCDYGKLQDKDAIAGLLHEDHCIQKEMDAVTNWNLTKGILRKHGLSTEPGWNSFCNCDYRKLRHELEDLDHHIDCPAVSPMIFIPERNLRIRFVLLPYGTQDMIHINSFLMVYTNNKIDDRELSNIVADCIKGANEYIEKMYHIDHLKND